MSKQTNTLASKNYLSAADLCKILDCGRCKAYDIIKTLNDIQIKAGITTYSGKVRASFFYEKYGLEDLLQSHQNYVMEA